ncbi:hypothetical protein GCM10022224_049320 [Nonomuraea antimicrobica]|uniref:Uncharacterized protein n=1 Tax=Nonomuraea antimicrobica TaxID=561173 RepID=A0ABP7C4R0_9ACTN
MKIHLGWEVLPGAIQKAVQSHCGRVNAVTYAEGRRAGLAVRIYGSHDDVFLRGIPLRTASTLRYAGGGQEHAPRCARSTPAAGGNQGGLREREQRLADVGRAWLAYLN